MFAVTWILAVCAAGVTLAAPHATFLKAVAVAPVKTVSITHEVVSEQPPPPPPAESTLTVVKSHGHLETSRAVGTSVATFVGNLFTNLGNFLSETIRAAPQVRKVVVQQPVVKTVVVQEPVTAAPQESQQFVFQKTKTVSVH